MSLQFFLRNLKQLYDRIALEYQRHVAVDYGSATKLHVFTE